MASRGRACWGLAFFQGHCRLFAAGRAAFAGAAHFRLSCREYASACLGLADGGSGATCTQLLSGGGGGGFGRVAADFAILPYFGCHD